MATLKTQKARKVYVCSKCSLVIPVGVLYYRFSVSRFQKLRIRCRKCKPTRQEMTNSGFMSTIYDIDDMVQAYGIEQMDDPQAIVDEVVQELESLREETEDSLFNMPEHLQESSSSGQMLQERVDAVQEMIDELEGVETEIDDADDMDEDELEEAKNEVLLSIQAVEYQGP